MKDELLTFEQVRDLLKCSKRSVMRWRLNGTLPPTVKIGRCIRFRRTDIETFLANDCIPWRKTARRAQP